MNYNKRQVDPTRERQLEELNIVELCTEILQNARNELYIQMRYFDVALSSLGFLADQESRGMGTDGFLIYYHPDYLCRLYKQGRISVNRSYLHMVLHCLLNHLDGRGKRAEGLWNLACDIAVESIIDSYHRPCVHIPLSPYRRETYLRLKKKLRVLNAEGVYHILQEMELTEKQYQRMADEFYVDDHEWWRLDENSPKTEMMRQNQWKEHREKLQTEMETSGSQEEQNQDSVLEQVQIENRERYDYRQFLRKFSVLKEEVQVDPDSFDPVFYTYGMNLYGNMPLIEPLESREVNRIEDFVIVVDTSMSCSGDLVKRFLEETYDVLSESETYFRKINIHIIQCDEQVRDDQVITSRETMEQYMNHFTVAGQGGTDFRPAFEYVNGLMALGQFHSLKGLIYFTDGKGIYPVKRPVYETAFVFIEDQYTDLSVPPWAVKLILEPGQLMVGAEKRQEEGESQHEY